MHRARINVNSMILCATRYWLYYISNQLLGMEYLQPNHKLVWAKKRLGLIPNFIKFGHDLFVLGFKRWGGWCVLFLEHHKSKGMKQEEEGGNNKQQRKTKGKSNLVKPKVVICMNAT
jgi:hypothetical protein